MRSAARRPAFKRVALFALSFMALVAPAAQAQEPLSFFKNYFVTGDYVVRGVSLWRKGANGRATALIPALRDPDGAGPLDGVPATADILAAFLYVQTAEKVQGSGIDRARFIGHDLGRFTAPGSLEPGSGTFAKPLVEWDTAVTPCWSVAYPGRRRLMTYRVDVLRFLPIDPVTEKQSLTTTHQIVVPDAGDLFGDDDEERMERGASNLPRALGASLIVVYRDRSKPFSAITLYDGAYTKRAYARMEQPIGGFYQASTVNPRVKMTHVVGDGRPLLSERVYLGSQLIATNPFRSLSGPKWDNVTWQWDQPTATPLRGNASDTTVRVDPHTLLSDCLTYSAIAFRTTVQDSDTDGLIDIWESSNTALDDPNVPNDPVMGTGYLPNLRAMGADPKIPDIFAQLDYLYAADPTVYGDTTKPAHHHLPSEAALTMVGDAFANAPVPIKVHFDVGDNYQGNPYVVPAEHARGGQSLSETSFCPADENDPAVTAECPQDPTGRRVMPGQFPQFPGTVGWKTGFAFLKDAVLGFDRNRKDIFRYVLAGHFIGLPVEPCLRALADGTQVSDFACQDSNPLFRVPRTNSGIADFPGAELLLSLGAFDNADGLPVGSDYQVASTIMHEWGHTLLLTHAGILPSPDPRTFLIQREPNCKPNYFSVMNYLFQLRGLPDVNGILRLDYSRETVGGINEFGLIDGPMFPGANPKLDPFRYRTGWYAPRTSSYVKNLGVKAATKHCDGSPLTPEEQAELDNGGGMVRIDASSVFGNIDWNADGTIGGAPPQDVNFNGLIDGDIMNPALKPSSNDWMAIRLNELGGRRNVGGYYRDTLGRNAVGPMSLDVGRGDIGRGDIGRGDIGRGDIGRGDIGRGDIGVSVGRGDIGRGDIGRGDIGRGDIGLPNQGRGDIGRGDIGRGDIGRGGGDLDVGSADEPEGDMPLETAIAAEGDAGTGPPVTLVACLTSSAETCVNTPEGAADARTPVNVAWLPPNLGAAAVVDYKLYRLQFEGTFEPFEPPADLSAAVEVATVVEGTAYSDAGAPSGAQLAYFARARYDKLFDATFDATACLEDGGTILNEETCRLKSAISNFSAVRTPSASADLTIANYVPASPARSVAPGAAVTLSSWRHLNQGSGGANAADGTISNGFYLSADPVITTADLRLDGNVNTNDVLGAGAFFDWGGPTVTIPAGTAPGLYYIGILVDEANEVAESDEGNNFVSEPIAVVTGLAPTATSAIVTTPVDTPISGALEGNDPDGGPLTFAIVDPPDHGSLTGELPNVTYTPNEGFTGVDSFTFTVSDGVNTSLPATITITVADFVVRNTNDSGAGSLRQAMLDADDAEGTNTITFNIPGEGSHTIAPLTALPTINDPVVIDGYTQPGAAPASNPPATLLIELSGQNLGAGAIGLLIRAGSSIVRGLAINRFQNAGIFLRDGGNNTVEGNYLGTNLAGTAAGPGNGTGVMSTSPNNVIGGATTAARNVISGNSLRGVRATPFLTSPDVFSGTGAGTVIRGNYIGTDATGTEAIPNGTQGGITAAVPVVVGGTTEGAGNLISGNARDGLTFNASVSSTGAVLTTASGSVVQGNRIGTDASGTAAVPNMRYGALVLVPNVTIGSIAPTSAGSPCVGACNVIAGNGSILEGGNTTGGGVSLFAQTFTPPDGGPVTPVTLGSQTVVRGNFIGVNAQGNAVLRNLGNAVVMETANNTIDANVASGSGLGPDTGPCGDVGQPPCVARSGIRLAGAGATGNLVTGNFVGTDASGTIALDPSGATSLFGNTGPGVHISEATGNIIGGFTPAERNVIAGNFQVGVNLNGAATTANVIRGNYIGTDRNGAADLGNLHSGVGFYNGAHHNLVGGADGDDGEVDGVVKARNVISGNEIHGVDDGWMGAIGNVIKGNYIGTDATGMFAIGNTCQGVGVHGQDTIVGGTEPGAGNLISGNAHTGGPSDICLPGHLAAGVALFVESSGAIVRGNVIGLAANGETPLPNSGDGVAVYESSNHRIGGDTVSAGNAIAFNGRAGIRVYTFEGPAAANSILSNRIFENGALGIDLTPDNGGAFGVNANDASDGDGGANNGQNFPVLTSSTTTGVQGTLNSTAATAFTLQFFVSDACDASRHGEGRRFLGSTSVTTDASGNAEFAFVFASAVGAGLPITATATDPDGNTSEFSLCSRNAFLTLLVNNTNDSGPGSFRQAILNANVPGFADTISFNIPGPGPHTITPLSPLPTILDPVTIDGYTQAGASPAFNPPATLMIELNGASAGANTNGLDITAGGSTVRGLAINRFGGSGIHLRGVNGGNVIEGNYLGTDVTGTLARGNRFGVTTTSPSTTIGGMTLAARNVIAGNTDTGVGVWARLTGAGTIESTAESTLIQGNFIGTNASGTAALSNAREGIAIGVENVVVGGTTPGARNVISGNSGHGIWIIPTSTSPGGPVVASGAGATVQGNFIGTNAEGTAAIGNAFHGISATVENLRIGGTDGTTPGGSCTGACNLISGNAQVGVHIGVQYVETGAVTSRGTNAIVQGNYVGLDVTGTLAIPNTHEGIWVGAPDAMIGGTSIAARNVVSGNRRSGIGLGALFTGANVVVSSATGAVVRGNYVGTNAAGDAAVPNVDGGISVWAPGTTVGGSSAGAANLVSGNAAAGVVLFQFIVRTSGTMVSQGSNTLVEGNYIGLAASGATALPNMDNGVSVGTRDNTIRSNTISGNGTPNSNPCGGVGQPACTARSGISMGADAIANTVTGNFIGTNPSGTAAIGNTAHGISISGVANNVIGGLTAGTRNIISGNLLTGVRIFGEGATGNLVQGNYIGTDASGLAAIPNLGTQSGVFIQNASANTIGGATPGARNVISGNAVHAVTLVGATGNLVQGNFIGVDATGLVALANDIGVDLVSANNNTVGGSDAAARNVISGNATAIQIRTAASGNVVQGNYIGTDANGAGAVPNGSAVQIHDNAFGNTIGGPDVDDGNVIANNGGGVQIRGDTSTGNAVLSNSIHSNGFLGIDLGSDGVTPNDPGDVDASPNHFQNFPEVSSATTTSVTGTLDSIANTAFLIQLFSNPACDTSGFGEGHTLVASFNVTTDDEGHASFAQAVSLSAGQFVTATATDPDGNTSEFSACVPTVPSTSISIVRIEANDPAAFEVGPDNGVFIVTRTGTLTSELVVNLEPAAGTATFNVDYQLQGNVGQQITIPAGEASATVTVVPTVDEPNEDDETVVLTLTSGNYVFGSPTTATVTITDEPLARIVATDPNATEAGDTASFTITPAGATTSDRDVFVEVSGTATFSLGGPDYGISGPAITTINSLTGNFTVRIPAGQTSVTVTITPVPDEGAEGAETVILTAEGAAATATIADEPLVTIVATDPNAAEAGGGTATFTINRGAGAGATHDRFVAVTVGGTATFSLGGPDYGISGPAITTINSLTGNFTVRIPAGQTSVTVTITPVPDEGAEGAETVILTAEGAAATATIADEPLVTIVATDPNAAEAGGGTATFTINRGAGAGATHDRFVAVTVGGTATFSLGGPDYGISGPAITTINSLTGNFTVRIPAGQTSVTVTITPVPDEGAEGAETVILTAEGTAATATIADESAQSVVDGDFGLWTFSSLANVEGGDATVTREPTGGNPGAHLRIATNPNGGEARGLAIFEGFSTVTPFAGAHYTFTFDARLFAVGAGQAVLLLIRQGNTIYESELPVIAPPADGWTPFSFTGTLDPAAFEKLLGTGPAQPDFSGATVTYFGFGGGNGVFGRTYDYDNFHLQIGDASSD